MRLNIVVHTDSVCSRSSSLSSLLLITDLLYCVFFYLPRKRNKKATLGGWCQSAVYWTPTINKNASVNIYKSLYYFMLFGVHYTDYISISCPEESGWNLCHNAYKLSSNTIETISTAAPDSLNAFLAQTKFVTSEWERKINRTSVYL